MAPTFLIRTTVLLLVSVFFASTASAQAESHTVKFDNQCGYGTPQLIKGNDLLTTTEYTSNGALSSAIAYLQIGDCGWNGEKCGTVEMTLTNPTTPGTGSSVDISYIPPLAFSVPVKFEYFGGCDGKGTGCDSANCPNAFYTPDETQVQVACQEDNVNLLITYCGDGSGNSTISSSASSSVKTSTTAAAVSATSTFTTQVAPIVTTQAGTTSSSVSVSGSASVSVSSASSAVSPSTSRKCSNRRKRSSTLERGVKRGLSAHRSRRTALSRL